MKHFVFSLITLLQVGFLCNAAQVGFNKIGYVANIPDNSFTYNSVAVQPDGKIVAVGKMVNTTLITRFNSDGSLDQSFNGTGFATNIPNASFEYRSVAIDGQGRIIAVGIINDGNESETTLIARFKTNGTLDTTFNPQHGGFITNIPNNSFGYYSVAIDNQGRIVVVGRTNNDFENNETHGLIARFNDNGSLDDNFGTNGFITNIPNNSFGYYSVAIDNQGRIVVVGRTNNDFENNETHGLIARFTSEGVVDTTFNPQHGFINIENDINSSWYFSVTIDRQDKILVVGQKNPLNGVIARFNDNGSLDQSFNGTGFSTNLPDDSFAYNSVAIDNDGSIIAVGVTAQTRSIIIKFDSNGILDTTFNRQGTPGYLTNVPSNSLEFSNIRIDRQGKIIVAGKTGNDNGLIARFLSNGVLDAESNWNLQNFRESNNINKVSIGLLG